MKGKQVITRTAKFFIDDNDILHIVMLPDVLVDELDIYDNYLVVRDLTERRVMLRCFDARANDWSMSEKAKIIAKQTFENKSAKAVAILIKSGITSSLLNFFNRFGDPEMPRKYFDNEKEAINWLLSLKL